MVPNSPPFSLNTLFLSHLEKINSAKRIHWTVSMSGWCFPQQKKQQCNKALLQQMLYLWICFLTKNRLESSSTYGRQQSPVNPKRIAKPFQETGFFSIVCAGRGGAACRFHSDDNPRFRSFENLWISSELPYPGISNLPKKCREVHERTAKELAGFELATYVTVSTNENRSHVWYPGSFYSRSPRLPTMLPWIIPAWVGCLVRRF